MAKKKKDIEEQDSGRNEHIDYPMSMVFQISLLAACVSFILLYLNNVASLSAVLFRSFLVFISFAVGGGVIVIIVFTIMANNRQRELREAEERAPAEEKLLDSRTTEQKEMQNQNFVDFGSSFDSPSDQNSPFSL